MKLVKYTLLTTAAWAIAGLAQANTLSLSAQFGLGSGFEASDINALGQVVGIDATANTMALWQAGSFTNVASSNDGMQVVGINNKGAVLFGTVGPSGMPSYQLYVDGSSSTVTAPSAVTVLNGLNDAQTLVGYQIGASGAACGTTISGATASASCISGSDAAFMAINNRGDKVLSTISGLDGVQSYLQASNGSLSNLGALTSVAGINDEGAVAGVAGGRAVRLVNGTSTDLLSSIDGASHIQVYDINNAGQIVGQYDDADGQTFAFLWGNDGLTQIDMALQGQGLQRVGDSRIGLNDLGQLVMTVYDTQAQDIGTIIMQSTLPATVPEPATYALMGLGLIGLTGRTLSQRRRA